MADIYTGKARSYKLRLITTINGVVTTTDFSPSIIEAFGSYPAITVEGYLKLSDTEFQARRDAYYTYVNANTTPPINLPGDLQVLPEIEDSNCQGEVNPEISVEPASLEFGDVFAGSSDVLSYALSGFNLTADIEVTVPSGLGYLISTSYNSGFTTTLTIPKDGNNAVNTTIYVQFTPSSESSYVANIVNSSAGATTENVSVTGSGVTASITVNPTSLQYPNVIINDESIKSYEVTGHNLSHDITITAATNFTIGLTNSGTFGNNLVLHKDSNGDVATTEIFVKFIPTAATNYGGNITNVSGSITKNVAVSGNGVEEAIPTILITPENIDFGDVYINKTNPEEIKSYTVSGTNLTADIELNISGTGFLHSFHPTSGFVSSTLSIPHTGGTVGNTAIYIQFSPTSYTSYSGTATASSTNATNKAVVLQGNGKLGVMSVDTSSIDFGYVVAGNSSAEEIVTVTGEGLGTTVDLAAPSGFLLSKTSGGTFASTIQLTTTNGELTNENIYIKFSPTAESVYSGDITLTSVNSTGTHISVSGTAVIPVEITIDAMFDNSAGAYYPDIVDGDTITGDYVVADTTAEVDITVTHSGGGGEVRITGVSKAACPDYGSLLLTPSSLPWVLPNISDDGVANLALGSGVGTVGVYTCDVTITSEYREAGGTTWYPLSTDVITVEMNVTA